MISVRTVTNPLIALLMFGAVLILMSIYEVYGRAEIEVDGVIIKSEIVCQQPNNNRCVTNYLVKQILGERQTIFSAGPTDLSLP